FYDEIRRRWGEPGFVEGIVRNANPDASDEEVSAFVRVYRLSVSPGAAAQFNQMSLDVDVSGVLPAVRVPTLIFHRPDAPAVDNVRIAEYMASRIPSARIVALPGRNQVASLGDQAPLFAELERFLSLLPEGECGEPQEAERVLATVLFTDV